MLYQVLVRSPLLHPLEDFMAVFGKKRVSFYADDETDGRLEALAESRQIGRSDVILHLIHDAFSQRDRYVLAAVGYQATL